MMQIIQLSSGDYSGAYLAILSALNVLACFVAVELLALVQSSRRPRRELLTFVTALYIAGILWATHFALLVAEYWSFSLDVGPVVGVSLAVLSSLGLCAWLVMRHTWFGRQRRNLTTLLFIVSGTMVHCLALTVASRLLLSGGGTVLSGMVVSGLGVVSGAFLLLSYFLSARDCRKAARLAMLLTLITGHFTAMGVEQFLISYDFLLGDVDTIETGVVATLCLLLLLEGANVLNEEENPGRLGLSDDLKLDEGDLSEGAGTLQGRDAVRRRLAEEITTHRDDLSMVAILTIELRNVRQIVSSHGTFAAEHALQCLIDRLSFDAAPDELVARISVDRFVALKCDIFVRGEVLKFAEHMRARVGEPVKWAGENLTLSCHVGVAEYPRDGSVAKQLLKRSEITCERARRLGTNKIMTYAPGLEYVSGTRNATARHLRDALDGGEIIVEYQPLVYAESRELAGFAALPYWIYGRRGTIPPDELFLLAEESGLMQEIGERYLRSSCRTAMSWPQGYQLSVKASPFQMAHDTFAALVADIVQDTGLMCSRLNIEVPESAILADAEQGSKVLELLKRQGIGMVLEGFGGGYSSLSTLRSFPFDGIKFSPCGGASEEAIRCATTVRSTILMARNLEKTLIACGVTDDSQFAFFREEGCHIIQLDGEQNTLTANQCLELIKANDKANVLTEIQAELRGTMQVGEGSDERRKRA